MGKIRVQDLARSMGLDNQDLVFKLKSIGVRVEGDEALIDTEIIQAILQGKKLPQPREVILRDDSAPKTARGSTAPLRRPGGPRPRRTMIQRVESRIRELDVRPKGVDELHPANLTPPEPVAEAPPMEAAPGIDSGGATPAQDPVALEPSAGAELAAGAPAAGAPAAGAPAAGVPAAGAPAAGVPAAGAPATASTPASHVEPQKPPSESSVKSTAAAETQVETSRAASSASAKTTSTKAQPTKIPSPSAEVPAPATAQPAPAEAKPPPKSGKKSKVMARLIERPPERPAGAPPSKAPVSTSRMRSQQDRGRGRRPGAGRQDERRVTRASAPSAAQPPKRPVSERGKRRAKRKQEEPQEVTSSGLKFKDDRPTGPVTIAEGLTVREFAEKLGVKSKDLIRTLVMRGVMANINHVLDLETAKSLADEMGIDVVELSFEKEVQLRQETKAEVDGDLAKVPRAPVVTVMGHVDHGKTTLLDSIRSARVAEGEAGGITQHIGAYQVSLDGKKIVFLDTPGHEAFTMMRARGASVTDIVVLVVAADDSVMPQTIEAINHAKAAQVPIIVAINKIDKSNANLDRVRKELADHGLMVEDWGGDVVSVPISALKGEGVNDLLEMILLTADILELESTPDLPAHGVVLEARKDIGRGIIADVLVQNGTLNTGDIYVAGSCWGRVRMMTDDRGQRLQEAGPATPVEVTGFTEVPGAGDVLQVMDDEAKARSIAELRRDEERQRGLAPQAGRMSLEQLFNQMEQEEVKELAVVVKADVDGSAEVLRDTLLKLSTEKVTLKVIHMGVGGISVNDVLLASASDAIIVGFNVRPERNAASLAEKEGVEIRLHTVIYELIDELKKAMAGLLEPVFREVHTGTAEIRNTFKVPKIGVVAGCHIVDGVIPRTAMVRLLRDSRVVWEGRISSLKRFKDDVSEVRSGFDCGIGLERFQDIKPGDSLEAFTREEVAPSL